MTARSVRTAKPKSLMVTIEEAAPMVGMTVAQLRKRMHLGDAPPSALLGKRRYFRVAELELWIDELFGEGA